MAMSPKTRPPKADKPKKNRGDQNNKKQGPSEQMDHSTRMRKRGLILCIIALPVLCLFYVLLLYWSNPHTEGRQLRIDQYITLLPQGRVHSAVILDQDRRIIGTYDRGRYWVAIGNRETL